MWPFGIEPLRRLGTCAPPDRGGWFFFLFWRNGETFIWRTQMGVYQYVLIKSIMTIGVFVTNLTGTFGDDNREAGTPARECARIRAHAHTHEHLPRRGPRLPTHRPRPVPATPLLAAPRASVPAARAAAAALACRLPDLRVVELLDPSHVAGVGHLLPRALLRGHADLHVATQALPQVR
jgi:hypothetical protein